MTFSDYASRSNIDSIHSPRFGANSGTMVVVGDYKQVMFASVRTDSGDRSKSYAGQVFAAVGGHAHVILNPNSAERT